MAIVRRNAYIRAKAYDLVMGSVVGDPYAGRYQERVRRREKIGIKGVIARTPSNLPAGRQARGGRGNPTRKVVPSLARDLARIATVAFGNLATLRGLLRYASNDTLSYQCTRDENMIFSHLLNDRGGNGRSRKVVERGINTRA